MEGRATETNQEQELETSNKEEPIMEPDNNGNERMNMMRGKMMKSRKRQELLEKREQRLMNRQKIAKMFNGRRVLEARDTIRKEVIQDEEDLVVTGADMEGLYPNLSDIEVAQLCFEAIMNSDIKFENIDYQKAGTYVALHLTEDEQRRSPLARILPRRKAGVRGVRPGVSSNPNNDEC